MICPFGFHFLSIFTLSFFSSPSTFPFNSPFFSLLTISLHFHISPSSIFVSLLTWLFKPFSFPLSLFTFYNSFPFHIPFLSIFFLLPPFFSTFPWPSITFIATRYDNDNILSVRPSAVHNTNLSLLGMTPWIVSELLRPRRIARHEPTTPPHSVSVTLKMAPLLNAISECSVCSYAKCVLEMAREKYGSGHFIEFIQCNIKYQRSYMALHHHYIQHNVKSYVSS